MERLTIKKAEESGLLVWTKHGGYTCKSLIRAWVIAQEVSNGSYFYYGWYGTQPVGYNQKLTPIFWLDSVEDNTFVGTYRQAKELEKDLRKVWHTTPDFSVFNLYTIWRADGWV